jgi:hypothetical protein
MVEAIFIKSSQSQSQYSLFSLGMFTYTYERQDITQIALKKLPGGGERRKKKQAPPCCERSSDWICSR